MINTVKSLNLILPFLLLIMFFVITPHAYALCAAGETLTDLGCLPSDPVPFVEKFYAWGLGIIGFVALLFMIIGGYFIMASRGNFEMLARGKSFIFYAITGLLLGIFGFIFIEILTGDILKIPGFN